MIKHLKYIEKKSDTLKYYFCKFAGQNCYEFKCLQMNKKNSFDWKPFPAAKTTTNIDESNFIKCICVSALVFSQAADCKNSSIKCTGELIK